MFQFSNSESTSSSVSDIVQSSDTSGWVVVSKCRFPFASNSCWKLAPSTKEWKMSWNLFSRRGSLIKPGEALLAPVDSIKIGSKAILKAFSSIEGMILASWGDDNSKQGLVFTSKIQGFSSESRMKSYPKT